MEYKNFDDMPMFISVPEAAKLLGISPQFIYQSHKKGTDFPIIIMGRRKVVPRDEFKKWVDDKCKNHTD